MTRRRLAWEVTKVAADLVCCLFAFWLTFSMGVATLATYASADPDAARHVMHWAWGWSGWW